MLMLRLTRPERTPHQLGLRSFAAVEQPALPLRPQDQRRGTAVRGRVRRPSPQERQIHGHGFNRTTTDTREPPCSHPHERQLVVVW